MKSITKKMKNKEIVELLYLTFKSDVTKALDNNYNGEPMHVAACAANLAAQQNSKIDKHYREDMDPVMFVIRQNKQVIYKTRSGSCSCVIKNDTMYVNGVGYVYSDESYITIYNNNYGSGFCKILTYLLHPTVYFCGKIYTIANNNYDPYMTDEEAKEARSGEYYRDMLIELGWHV